MWRENVSEKVYWESFDTYERDHHLQYKHGIKFRKLGHQNALNCTKKGAGVWRKIVEMAVSSQRVEQLVWLV